MKTCETCRWQKEAHCHFNPPTAHLVMAQGLSGPQPQPVSVHPPVRPDNFCAQHDHANGFAIIDA